MICVLAIIGSNSHLALPAAAAERELYVGLHYETDAAAGPCWDESEFRKNVARRVGYDPFRDTAPVNMAIRVSGSARALDGTVEWRNAQGAPIGERRFVAKDGNCLRLLNEMSFAVGLQIQLLRSETPGQDDGPPVAATPSAREPVANQVPSDTEKTQRSSPAGLASATLESRAAPSKRAPEPARALPNSAMVGEEVRAPSRWSAWVGAGPSLALGMAPSATASMRVFFAARRSSLSIEIGGQASYPTTLRQSDGSGFHEWLIGMNTALCAHRNVVSACALGGVSQVRVAGMGVDQPRTPTGLIVHAGLRLATTLDLGGPWFIIVRTDALGLLTPCTVDLNQAAAWDMPRLGALVGIDAAARFQ